MSGINALIRRDRTTPAQPRFCLFLLVCFLPLEETLGRRMRVLSFAVVSDSLQSCGL